MDETILTAKYDSAKIGEVDDNGLVIYEPKDLSEHMEWISLKRRIEKLNNYEVKLLFEIMDRGATRDQAMKTLKQIREMAVEPIKVLNELTKVSGVEEEKKEELKSDD